MLLALTRPVPPSIVSCELTHLARAPIDVRVASAQHERYEAALAALGCAVERLPAEPDLADSVFVEDTAVVVDELAVITRPGAESRRAETASVAAALGRHRALRRIEAPGTLDGGDVLQVGRRVYVGLTGRTNAEGVAQLRDALGPLGYTITGIPVRGCLHLKTAVTAIADDMILVNPRWIELEHFAGFGAIAVHPDEPFAANVLRVGRALLCSAAAPRTRELLEAQGYAVEAVDVSELAKAEAGVTCCSLLVRTP